MDDDDRRQPTPPDSLSGKLDALFDDDVEPEKPGGDAEEALGEELPPKRPTDPPF